MGGEKKQKAVNSTETGIAFKANDGREYSNNVN